MLRIINNEENAITLTLSELAVNDSGVYQFEFYHIDSKTTTNLELEVFETNPRFDLIVFYAEFERTGDYIYKAYQEEKLIETGLCRITA
jgi:hypothetical protein